MVKIKGLKYDEINKLVIQIYVDYDIKSFPINVFDICKKMGIKVFSYFTFDIDIVELLKKRSNDGFSTDINYKPIIFYNDLISSKGRINLTICHEIKHIIKKDKSENNENEILANNFARYFLCPIPLLIKYKIFDLNEIMEIFGLSYEASIYVLKNLENRIKKYGYKNFEYEKPLLELFDNIKDIRITGGVR